MSSVLALRLPRSGMLGNKTFKFRNSLVYAMLVVMLAVLVI